MVFLSRALSGIDERTISDIYGQVATAILASELTNERLLIISADMPKINEGIGGPDFSDLTLTSVRGILWRIYQLMRANKYGTPPTDTSGSTGSGDTVVVEGRRYALWAEPLAGADVVQDGIGLDPDSSWEGWSIYVQTSAPSCYISGEELDTNVWLDLSGSSVVTAAVDRQYPIIAYIRDEEQLPTSPHLLFTGENVVPTQSGDYPAAGLTYFELDIPVWADRIQIRAATSFCAGSHFWVNNVPLYLGAFGSGGCVDTTISVPVGAFGIWANSGGADQRWTGSVWALAPGVDPVP
jgi:hypothetical protein